MSEQKQDQPAQIEVDSEQGAAKDTSQEVTPASEQPKPKLTVDTAHRTVKACYVQRQGLLWKKWNRQYMILEDGGACLRFFKSEARNGNDGALFMKFCADVTEPKEDRQATWPPGSEGRCFVVCSPKRAHYIVAETTADKDEWMEKLVAAKEKFNTEGHTVVATALLSVEALKHTIDSSIKHFKASNETAPASKEPSQATPTQTAQAPRPESKPTEAMPPTQQAEAEKPKEEPKEKELPPPEKQPEVAEQQPEVSEQPEEVAKQQPEVAEQQPEVAEQQPEVAEQQPEVTEQQPEVAEQKPEVAEQQPEVAEQQPEVAKEPEKAEDPKIEEQAELPPEEGGDTEAKAQD